ncbi:cytochrome P450 [Zopfochytrium polystomum]|nr:cytochrome P450 [Zopfochytrium polystomum]
MHVIRRASPASLLAAAASAALAGAAVRLALLLIRMHLRTRRPPIAGVPSPKQHYLWGHLPFFVKNRHREHHMLLETFKTLGTNWSANLPNAFGIPAFLHTVDPAVVQHVLRDGFEKYHKGDVLRTSFYPLLGDGIFVTSGETWRRTRKIASLIFTAKSIREPMTQAFHRTTIVLLKHLKQAAESREILDLDAYFRALATDSFAEFAFHEKLDCLENVNSPPAFAAAFDGLCLVLFANTQNPFAKLLSVLPTKRNREIRRMADVMDEFAYSKIRARRAAAKGEVGEKPAGKDLLDLFMEYRDEAGNELSDKDLRDMMINMLLAGRDTTSIALSWAIFELAKRPDVVQKIRDEVESVVRDGLPTYDTVKDLTYVTAVFYETLRLHPSVPNDGRFVLQHDILPGGISIAPKTRVTWSTYSMNRMESLWGPDAESFEPDRWLQVDKESGAVALKRESPFKWPVFNGGPRLCLGMTMATFQAVLVLATVLWRFDFEVLEPESVWYANALTLNMKSGMKVLVREARER